MKPGSWSSIFTLYLYGVMGASTVSKIVPLGAVLGSGFGTGPAQFGWLVSLVALPAVILAIPSGLLVDRFGPRRILIGAALLGIAANLLYFIAPSQALMQVARILEGTAIVHVYTAVPAFLMSSCEGTRRSTAMTIWATYMPTGTAVGLLLAGAFVELESWRGLFLVHGALWGVVGVLNLRQPLLAPPPANVAVPTLGQRLQGLKDAYSRPALLLLALAFFLMISLGFGANTTFPGYFAHIHDVSVAKTSGVIALATLLMIPGSLSVGALIARGITQRTVFLGLGLVGACAGSLAFNPSLSIPQRAVAVGFWFVVSGAALATLMATLPLVAEPARRGAAAALLNQSAATATFVNPPIWLPLAAAGASWLAFAGLITGAWIISVAGVWMLARFANPGESR